MFGQTKNQTSASPYLLLMVDNSNDPENEDLFQHIFGDIDTFDHIIYEQILLGKEDKNLFSNYKYINKKD